MVITPTRPTLIFQEVGVSLTLTQRVGGQIVIVVLIRDVDQTKAPTFGAQLPKNVMLYCPLLPGHVHASVNDE